MVAPIFVALLMAVFEFSLVFFTLTSAQHAVWDAARQLSVGRTTTTAARDAVTAAIPQWARTQSTVTANKDPADATRYLVTASIPLTAAAPTTYFAALFGSRAMTASATLVEETP